MPSYEVIKPCYTPFGAGKLRHRAVGKVVTLTVEEAQELDGFVRLVGEETVRFPDTETVPQVEDSEPPVRFPDTVVDDGEVIDDGGSTDPVNGRTDTEAD